MKAWGIWAGIEAALLVLAAPIMLVFGVILSISPPGVTPDGPGALIGGGALSALAAIVTGVLLLIGGSRPQRKKRAWGVAAFVLATLGVLLGPVYSTGMYLWLTSGS